jgi:hypothetical protein
MYHGSDEVDRRTMAANTDRLERIVNISIQGTCTSTTLYLAAISFVVLAHSSDPGYGTKHNLRLLQYNPCLRLDLQCRTMHTSMF